MERELRTPFFIVNPKAYLFGDASIEMAQQLDELAKKYDTDILFTCQHADLYRVKQATTRVFVTAQHMDGMQVGAGMGHILPESIAATGAEATFLNHAEHRMELENLIVAMKRAKELGIKTIVCASSIAEAKVVASLHPDIMVCEPTELIGTGQSSDESYMKDTNEVIRAISPDILILQAAGISSAEDVRKALASGADATGGTSGILKADDPIQKAEEMLQEMKAFTGGHHAR